MVKSLVEAFSAVHSEGFRHWGHEKGGLVEAFDPAQKANNMSGVELKNEQTLNTQPALKPGGLDM